VATGISNSSYQEDKKTLEELKNEVILWREQIRLSEEARVSRKLFETKIIQFKYLN
jgi:hypothetical protein